MRASRRFSRYFARMGLNLELSGAVRVFRPVDVSGTSWERSSGIYILPLVTVSGYSSHYRPRHNLDSARCWAELFLFAFLALACSPGPTFCRGRKSRVHPAGWPDMWHYGILALSALFIVFFTDRALLLFPLRLNPHDPRSTNQEALFLAYRSLHLDRGVSPRLPLPALLAANFSWVRVHPA